MKRILSLAVPFLLAFLLSVAVHAETNMTGAIRASGDITPSQITGNQNNYNPSGLKNASVLRLSTDASRDITGLAGGYDGRIIIIHNIGSNDLVLKDASGSSAAANRFALIGDATLTPDTVALLQYDGTSSVWRLVGGTAAGGIAHSSLSGLTSGDDHTQYALLAGRSGGQTLNGGTAAGNNLTISSTANASKGTIISDSRITIERSDSEAMRWTANIDTTGPKLTTKHVQATPANGDQVLTIEARALNAATNDHVVGVMAVLFDDVTTASMDSSMAFTVCDNVNDSDGATTATLTSLGAWTDSCNAVNKTFEGKMGDILNKVKNLKIEKYRSSRVKGAKVATATRHYSCTAEDFYATFGLGDDPTRTYTDEHGNVHKLGGIAGKDAAFLALDCIQRLIEENEALKARVAALEAARP